MGAETRCGCLLFPPLQFFAIDCEFTGLFLEDRSTSFLDDMEDRYAEVGAAVVHADQWVHRASAELLAMGPSLCLVKRRHAASSPLYHCICPAPAPQMLASSRAFVINQFGLSAYVWEEGAYRPRTFNFYTFPRPFEGADKRFVCQASRSARGSGGRYGSSALPVAGFGCGGFTQGLRSVLLHSAASELSRAPFHPLPQASSLDFLASCGFDFNKAIYDGVSYMTGGPARGACLCSCLAPRVCPLGCGRAARLPAACRCPTNLPHTGSRAASQRPFVGHRQHRWRHAPCPPCCAAAQRDAKLAAVERPPRERGEVLVKKEEDVAFVAATVAAVTQWLQVGHAWLLGHPESLA